MSVCACVCVCVSLSLSLSLSVCVCVRARRARVCVQIDWIPVAPPFLLVGHSAGSLYMRQVHFVHEDVTGVNSGEFGEKLIAEILLFFRGPVCAFLPKRHCGDGARGPASRRGGRAPILTAAAAAALHHGVVPPLSSTSGAGAASERTQASKRARVHS